MVKFSEYLESMVALKPEWRNAYINYAQLNSLLQIIKQNVRCAEPRDESDQSLPLVHSTDAAACDACAPPSAPDDEDAFVVQRTAPLPIHKSGGFAVGDERQSLLQHRGSYPIAFGSTPPFGTPPFGTDHSHKVFGNSFRCHPMESAVPPPDNRGHAETSSPTFERFPTPPLGPMPLYTVRQFLPNTPPIPVASAGPSPPLVVPLMSPDGVSAAKQFEDLLLAEVERASTFARESFDTFAEYVESNRVKWAEGKGSKARTKDTLRYLHKELGHLVQFVETNELAVKTATKKYLHSHPFYIRVEVSEESLLPKFEGVLSRATQLQGVIASQWAKLFNDGDINAARGRINAASASSTQSFRAGLFFGLIIACGLYWLHVRFELQPTADVMSETNWMFPIVRLFISMLFALVCWSWVLYVFERGRINYLYVFEFSQTASTSWMQCLEYSLMMFFLCSLFGVLYVRSSLHNNMEHCYSTAEGFPFLSPYIVPTFFVLWMLTIVFPIRHVFAKTRNAFGRVFFKCMKLPFGDVRFVEFFVADWGTSLVFPCGDLLYFVCFYTVEAPHAFTNTPGGRCLDIQHKYNFPVAMIPYFWRACQTFKMYLKTGIVAHLVNHGKYQTFLVYFIVSWAYVFWPSDALNDVVWFMHFAAQLYAWVWDILMDWGWIKGRSRAMMFKSKLPYIAAGVVDFVLRMYFVFCTLYIQPAIGQNYMYLIQATVEIFRRSMWSIFRIENENINNLESYRKIDFVPHVAPRDEVG